MPIGAQGKQAFVRKLAEYLAGDQGAMSVRLQLNDPDAKAWAALRRTTPLFGYPTVEEAEQLLGEWLR